MHRLFAKNILFLLFVNIVVKPFWVFGIDTQVQNTLGNEAYGIYFSFLNISLIFQILLDFGLQSYSTNTISKAHNTFATIFPNIIVNKFLLTLLYYIVIFVTGCLMGFGGEEIALLLFISTIQVCSSFLLFFRSNIAAFQQFKTDSLLSVLDRVLIIVLCGSLLYIPALHHLLNLYWFVGIQIVALFAASIIALSFCVRQQQIRWQQIDFKKMRIIVRKSFPYALLIFLMAVFIRVDAVLINELLGSRAAGLYGAAFRWLDVINNSTGVLIGGMLLPFFAKHLKDKTPLQPVLNLLSNTLLPFSFIIAVVGVFWSQPLMDILYKDNDPQYSYITLTILLCAFPFYCLNYIYSTLLTANQNIAFLIKIAICACVLNITLNVFLIYNYNILGSSLASCATIAFFSVACVFKVTHLLPIQFISIPLIIKNILFVVLLTILAVTLKNTTLIFEFQLAIFGMSALIIYLLFQFIPVVRLVKPFFLKK